MTWTFCYDLCASLDAFPFQLPGGPGPVTVTVSDVLHYIRRDIFGASKMGLAKLRSLTRRSD